MTYGRSRLYDRERVAEKGDVAAAAVSRVNDKGRFDEPARGDAVARELDTLRSINAHLVRQVALLKQREAQAQRLADRDGLTGLYNRRRMVELLDSSLADAAIRGQRVGLLFIDLDGFKAVNDAHGHAVGDELLITVASRIAARARTADFVCRYGGDEFVVILPRVADLSAVSRVADSIRARVALPYRIAGIDLRMSAAIGMSLYPDQADTAAELIDRADDSMYRAKAHALDPAAPNLRLPAPARRREDESNRRSEA
jgi:diguanylate cyclase (GGDEF)-like protein